MANSTSRLDVGVEFRDSVDLRTGLLCEVDELGTIREVSLGPHEHTRAPGSTGHELQGRNLLDLVHPDERAAVRQALPAGTPRSLLCRFAFDPTSWTTVDLEVAVSIDGRHATHVRLTPTDVRRRASAAGVDVLTALLHHVDDGVLACNEDGFIVVLNRAMRELLRLPDGAPSPTCWPSNVRLLALSGDRELTDQEHPLMRANRGEQVHNEEMLLQQPDGVRRHVVANGQALPALGRRAAGAAVAFRDVTDQRQFEQELRRQALHDPLTQLPNRLLLADELASALRRRGTTGLRVAVIFLDLDHFKEINDSLGHSQGDVLLSAIAARLTACLPPQAMLARLGGDEFVCLLDVVDASAARAVALRLEVAMEEPFSIADLDIVVTASIGVALDDRDDQTSSALLRNADAAMYEAKNGGRNRVHLFDDQQRLRPAHRFEQRQLVQRAVDSGEILVHFQPIMDVHRRRMVGAEALLRLFGPEGEVLPPAAFLGVAEDTGLITRLDSLVLDRALATARSWHDLLGNAAPAVSVNVSARQLARPDFAQIVHTALDANHLPGSALFLELTESSLLTVTDRTVSALHELRERNVHIGVDDFGIGYSSLRLVGDLPFSFLKIDRSFVTGLLTKPSDRVVVRVILDLCRQLDLQVMAEGIETTDQMAALETLGCPWLQGFLFARPMAEQQIFTLLSNPFPEEWFTNQELNTSAA